MKKRGLLLILIRKYKLRLHTARRANTCEDSVFAGASQVFFILAVFLVVILVGCSGSKEPAPKVAKSPAIPHEVTQDMDCKSCHESGANGAKITKHLDRPNCTSCHKVKQ